MPLTGRIEPACPAEAPRNNLAGSESGVELELQQREPELNAFRERCIEALGPAELLGRCIEALGSAELLGTQVTQQSHVNMHTAVNRAGLHTNLNWSGLV